MTVYVLWLQLGASLMRPCTYMRDHLVQHRTVYVDIADQLKRMNTKALTANVHQYYCAVKVLSASYYQDCSWTCTA